MTDYAAFLLVLFLSFGTTVAAMPLLIRLSFRLGITSTPGGRRQEAQPLPKLGGAAIFLGFTIAVIAAQYLPVPPPRRL